MTMTFIARSLAGLALAAAIAGPAGAADKPSIVEGGKFTVCTDPSFPPMEYFKVSGDKEPVGFDVDLMRALAKGWGAGLEIVSMDFAGLLPSLEAKRCDAVISGMFVTDKRKQSFDAVSYLDTVTILVAKGGTARAKSIDDFSGKTIAVQTGTTFVQLFEKINTDLKAKGLKPVDVQLYPKASDGIQQVLIGRAYATTTQDTELAYRELQNPGALTSVFEFEDEQSFGIFVRKGGNDGAAVHEALTSLEGSGALAEIAGRWHLNAEKLSVRQ
jgi:polar amino acid transport system substrate-binding protein